MSCIVSYVSNANHHAFLLFFDEEAVPGSVLRRWRNTWLADEPKMRIGE